MGGLKYDNSQKRKNAVSSSENVLILLHRRQQFLPTLDFLFAFQRYNGITVVKFHFRILFDTVCYEITNGKTLHHVALTYV